MSPNSTRSICISNASPASAGSTHASAIFTRQRGPILLSAASFFAVGSAAEAIGYGRMPRKINALTGTPRAGTRPRQQRRSGASGAQEEDAAGRHFPRDEDARTLRKAFGEARTRESRGCAPRPQARPQARPARGSDRQWADGRRSLSAPIFRLFPSIGERGGAAVPPAFFVDRRPFLLPIS